jgi:hypothetical protein
MSGRIDYLQDSFNGKPKATFPGLLTGAVAFGLPLNKFMRLL